MLTADEQRQATERMRTYAIAHAQTGRPDAAVTLVQYGDDERPYTRLSRHAVLQLQREFPDSLRFVFRHFPLEKIHPHARAGAQTDFWKMHAYLFEHHKQLEDADLERYALGLGWMLIALSENAGRPISLVV